MSSNKAQEYMNLPKQVFNQVGSVINEYVPELYESDMFYNENIIAIVANTAKSFSRYKNLKKLCIHSHEGDFHWLEGLSGLVELDIKIYQETQSETQSDCKSSGLLSGVLNYMFPNNETKLSDSEPVLDKCGLLSGLLNCNKLEKLMLGSQHHKTFTTIDLTPLSSLKRLTHLTLGTSNIDLHPLADCKRLTHLEIPNKFDVNLLKPLENCNLESIKTFGCIFISDIRHLQKEFPNIYNLLEINKINLSNMYRHDTDLLMWDTSKVTNMSALFEGQLDITVIDSINHINWEV